MNQDFILGFIKQAQKKGLTKLDALDILKAAGPIDWLGNQWTNFKDTLNTNFNLSNNPVSHFLSAASSASPEGYFGGFDKRYAQSEDIDRAQNAKAYALAGHHRAQQGDRENMQEYLAQAQAHGRGVMDPTAAQGIAGNIEYTTNMWNTQQAQQQKDQEALDAKRLPVYNRLNTPLEFAEPGKALVPKPITPPAENNTSLLGSSSSIPSLRTNFNANQSLRKSLSGY